MTREEMAERMNSLAGDRTDDETLTFIKEMQSWVPPDEYTEIVQERDKYRTDYEDMRHRYRERFLGGTTSGEEVKARYKTEIEEERKPLTFDKLFKER